MRATYSPEDNKIRIYPEGTRVDSILDDEEYKAFKSAGFKWAAKQECFVAPRWTVQAEDWALELCDEIDDEDYSPEERAADRAERFSGYRDKRRSEAGERADAFDAGPSAFGHQSRSRAERQARRHDRHRTGALSQWSKAEYWQQRTEGVISHALYRSSAPVRRSRIKRLETEQRKHESSREAYRVYFEAWQKVATLEGANEPGKQTDEPGHIGFAKDSSPAFKLAYQLANSGCHGKYQHPRKTEDNARSIYSLLTDAAEPITPAEASALWLESRAEPGTPGTTASRLSQHYELRLTYERAMLAAEGGAASEVEMIPGGFIGSYQIHAVNKSPTSGKVVSVKLWGEVTTYRKGKQIQSQGLKSVNIERLPADAYRAPTDDELEQFKQEQARKKAERKATAPKAPPLINPTLEDAQRLQEIWNEHAKRKDRDTGASTVVQMTQAQYSARSKGTYGICSTAEVSERLRALKSYNTDRTTVFKIRTAPGNGEFYSARSVVVITDKPQKPIPWQAVDAAQAAQPTEETIYPRIAEVEETLRADWAGDWSDEQQQLVNDAVYVGLAYHSSQCQKGLTKRGFELLGRYRAEQPAELATV